MAWYFHKQTAGFLTTLIYGERTLLKPDPDWLPDPADDNPTAPPLVRMQNPDCTLPPEELLLPLSDQQYTELIAGQESGRMIGTNAKGYPVLQDRPAPTQEQIQSRQAADKTRHIAVANTQKAKLADRIATLRDAVANIEQPGMQAFAATAEEQEELSRCELALVQWKNYAIELGRVAPTGAPIVWPEIPDN